MKKLTATFSFLAIAAVASAAPLTPAQAVARANAHAGVMRAPLRAGATPIYARQGQFYIFSASDAAVVLPADDCAAPVLARFDSPVTSWDDMPEGARYWLDFLGRRVADGARLGLPAYAADEDGYDRDADRRDVPMLCQAVWGQYSPFNDDCPLSYGKHCVVGCGATALAQIMFYHKWPEKGKGENSYLAKSINQTVSMNFAETSFDWDNMLADYDQGNPTEAQNKAVAVLNRACGVAMSMNYSANGSTATVFDAGTGAYEYLDYAQSVLYLYRDYIPSRRWEQIIYDEMAAGRPVLYGGVSMGAQAFGHAFVCDGYQKGGYFHFNWGWNGDCNGYFLLDALDSYGPSYPSYTFNLQQHALIGIQKPAEGIQKQYDFICDNGIGAEDKPYSKSDYVTICSSDDCDIAQTMIWSDSYFLFQGYLGVEVENMRTGDVYYAQCQTLSANRGQGVRSFRMPCSVFLDNGVYKVQPVFRSRYVDDWSLLSIPEGKRQWLGFRVTDEGVQLTEDLSGIDQVKAGANSATASYYDLTGRRVAQPKDGVYVKVQGGKASKVKL